MRSIATLLRRRARLLRRVRLLRRRVRLASSKRTAWHFSGSSSSARYGSDAPAAAASRGASKARAAAASAPGSPARGACTTSRAVGWRLAWVRVRVRWGGAKGGQTRRHRRPSSSSRGSDGPGLLPPRGTALPRPAAAQCHQARPEGAEGPEGAQQLRSRGDCARGSALGVFR